PSSAHSRTVSMADSAVVSTKTWSGTSGRADSAGWHRLPNSSSRAGLTRYTGPEKPVRSRNRCGRDVVFAESPDAPTIATLLGHSRCAASVGPALSFMAMDIPSSDGADEPVGMVEETQVGHPPDGIGQRRGRTGAGHRVDEGVKLLGQRRIGDRIRRFAVRLFDGFGQRSTVAQRQGEYRRA